MRSTVLRIALLLALAGFYVVGATTHARRVNTSKARGDQSGYLWDGQNVHANWHGQTPPVVIGERNRMPVYAGFLALFWDPSISNDEFFERAKIWNIYLSLGLLGVLAVIFAGYLPPLQATNLTVIVAFGYFVFKAGYVQSELLFYFLFFVAFLLFLELLRRPATGRGLALRGAAAGGAAALAHLTKASLLPLVAVFLGVFALDALARVRMERRSSLMRLAAAGLVALAFLAVLSPYLRTNKRVFGHYFYNVNTTFYMWYDNWPQASVGVIKHGDGVGWPTLPGDQLPGASRYWREHTLGEIAARVGGGFRDMADRSYQTYWYFKYVVLYLGFALAVALRRKDAMSAACRRRPALFAFVALYACVYLLGIAFYAPVSGTGTTRFLMAHLLPFFFLLSLYLSHPAFRETEWRIVGGSPIGVAHFHLLVSVMLAFDLTFSIWPRLMTTYGGF